MALAERCGEGERVEGVKKGDEPHWDDLSPIISQRADVLHFLGHSNISNWKEIYRHMCDAARRERGLSA